MKRRFFTTILAGFSCFVLTASLEAQTKLGIINLQKVFDGYWKTRQADVQLNDQANEFKKQEKEFTDAYQKTNEEYRKLLDNASDQAVAVEERDKKKKQAEDKLREIQKIEEQLRTFTQNARTNLGERYRRMRESVLREIQEKINLKAKEAGYNVVLDTASQSYNQTLVVVYNNGENDITEGVLKELNRDAPVEWLKPAEEKTTGTAPPKVTPPTDRKGGKK